MSDKAKLGTPEHIEACMAELLAARPAPTVLECGSCHARFLRPRIRGLTMQGRCPTCGFTKFEAARSE